MDSRNNIKLLDNPINAFHIGIYTGGGNILLNAKKQILLDSSNLVTFPYSDEQDSGDISIKSASLSLINASFFITSNSGDGKGGNITINASDFVQVIGNKLSDSAISAQTTGSGNAGNIEITTDNLLLQNAIFSSSTSSIGNAGSLIINVRNSVKLIESAFSNGVFGESSTGNGGNISVETRKISLQNSSITTSTAGKGNAGSLTINASESMEIGLRSLLNTSTKENANGNAGNISEYRTKSLKKRTG